MECTQFPEDLPVLELLTTRKGWERFSGGCYGTVYAPNGKPASTDWVIKDAQNDGTRTYLEWVILRTKQGRRMKGMPVIDWLIASGEQRYIVAMQRYMPCQQVIESYGQDKWNQLWQLKYNSNSYLVRLIAAFEDETGVKANDCHDNNFLYDERTKTLKLTDPSSRTYRPLGMSGSAALSGVWFKHQ